jgi:hypothetical protein
VEILNNLISVKNMLKECLTQNFIPTKLKELLAEKCKEGLLLNTTVNIFAFFFLASYFADSSFLWSLSGKFPFSLSWIYGNPR